MDPGEHNLNFSIKFILIWGPMRKMFGTNRVILVKSADCHLPKQPMFCILPWPVDVITNIGNLRTLPKDMMSQIHTQRIVHLNTVQKHTDLVHLQCAISDVYCSMKQKDYQQKTCSMKVEWNQYL